jgi:hypothetical protein
MGGWLNPSVALGFNAFHPLFLFVHYFLVTPAQCRWAPRACLQAGENRKNAGEPRLCGNP